MLSFCFSLTSTVTGGMALCHLTVYSPYSIQTADTQAIKAIPLQLNTTPITIGHNMESVSVKCSNFLSNADHKKHKMRYFAITTIMTSYKVTYNNHTKLSQYQQYKINIFWKNLRLLSLNHNHSYETVGELCSIQTSLSKHFITQPNKTKLTSNET